MVRRCRRRPVRRALCPGAKPRQEGGTRFIGRGLFDRVGMRAPRRRPASRQPGILQVFHPRKGLCEPVDRRCWRSRRSSAALDDAAANLVELHRLEQRLEVALAESVVALALDELEEHRPELVLGEDLQQQLVRIAVDQDVAPLRARRAARRARECACRPLRSRWRASGAASRRPRSANPRSGRGSPIPSRCAGRPHRGSGRGTPGSGRPSPVLPR